jgi:UDP-N-acetylglucosamine 2-epimerase (non-hydrolysing)
MKLAGLHHRFVSDARFEPQICHTGQHFDVDMSDVFWEALELPKPDFFLNVRAKGVAATIGATAAKVSELLQASPVDDVVVFGDVSGTAGAAIAAAHSSARLIHVEAGLRSFDRQMPEELNRIMVDHLSDLLLASEQSGIANLASEGIATERVHLVGNLMIECLIRTRAKWQVIERSIPQEFCVCTFHRPENVDVDAQLALLVERLAQLSDFSTLVWPLHPRTHNSLQAAGLLERVQEMPHVILIKPQGYFQFISLVNSSLLVLTDSGGIQEEASYMGKPCVTVRKNTERPVTVNLGTNMLLSLSSDDFVQQVILHYEAVSNRAKAPIPLWDDQVSRRIVDVMAE